MGMLLMMTMSNCWNWNVENELFKLSPTFGLCTSALWECDPQELINNPNHRELVKISFPTRLIQQESVMVKTNNQSEFFDLNDQMLICSMYPIYQCHQSLSNLIWCGDFHIVIIGSVNHNPIW